MARQNDAHMTALWVAQEARKHPGAEGNSTAIVDTAPNPRRIFVLPMPPSVNHSTMPTAAGGRYLTADHKAFRREVATIAGNQVPMLGRLRVSLVLYPETARRFDIDNRVKATLDALQCAGVYADDEQIDVLKVERVHGTKRGECIVSVAPLA